RVREVAQSLASDDMLIDADAAQKAESLLVLRVDDDRVALPSAAHQEAGEDRRTGTRPADHAAARQHVVECLLGLRVGVRVHEVPLAPALEPDTASLGENLREA